MTTFQAPAVLARAARRWLLLSAALVPQLAAAQATTAVGDAASPPSATVAPGAAARALDAFTLQTTAGTDVVTSATVTLAAGSWVALAAVSIQNTSACNQATPLGTNAPGSSVVTIALAGVTATPTLTTYHVCVTPKAHAAMPTPPGAEHAVTGTVTAISSTNPATYADATSATITVDNRSPGNATWGAITPASNQVTLAWTAPADADFTQVVVLRNANAPVVDGPAEGAILAPGDLLPNSRVVCVQAAGPCVDGGLTNGTPYYYRAFAKDGNGNYAIGVSAGPAYPGTNNLPVGSADGARPMVSILNPGDGAVVSGSTLQPFRVQARVWSPSLAIQAVELTTNGGASWAPLSKSANYGGTATSGVWEGQPTLAAGSYSLVVRARNDAAAWINSAPVGVIVKAPGTGDGRMLVRDNSSQLCSDCHAHKAHGSETVGTAYGSWSTVCRDCHTPHGTTNIFLVPTQITPPPRGAAVTPARDVVFHDRNVLENASRTGPCQVCHAQTKYYRADGTSPGGTHYTGDCARCHKHADGLKAKCTTCHGDATETRPLGPGADTLAYAAPPVVAPEAVVFVPDGGVHLSHANRATWRATVLACAECHATPNDHQGTTDVQWGTLATGGGTVTVAPATGAITSQWITTPSCTNYCHGASLAGGGGAVAAPAWDAPGPGGACGDCHASPPPLSSLANQDHPQNAACASCHGTGYAQLSLDPVAKVTHLDGTLGKPGNGCTACHGDLAGLSGAAQPNTNLAAAPGYTPGTGVDTEGHTAVTFPGVGAHEAHVKTGVMAAKSCEVCHGSKPADGNTSHANGTIALGFTSPANANGAPTTPTAFDATWEVTPTCTNYCHSNATPLGGALAQQTVTWTSATGMGCTSCHDAGGAASALSVAHRKHTSATTYAYGCERCHTSTTSDGTAITGPASHVDGGRTLAFNASPLDQAGAFYRGTATTPNHTCTNTYCHSSGVDRAPPFATGNSIAWTATSSCGSCHAGGSAMATRSHAAHVNNGTYLGTNVGCAGCHDTAASDSAIAAGKHGQHVNGLVETTGTSYADGTADGVANGSCGTSSCHSNGTENLVLADYRSVQWGVTALADDCKGCHGTEVGSIAGAPWYASSTASVKTRNSHPKHVGSASDCVTCHAGTVTALGALIPSGTLHLDGQGEVSGAGIGSYDPGTESCSTVTCHGTGTPVWGDPATATCASCHLTTAADRDSWVIDDGTPALVNGGEWTGYGHGSTSTTGNSFAEFAAVASSDRCAYCHDTQNASANHKQAGNPFRLRGAAGVGGATQPYDPTTSDVTRIAVCMNCHDNTNANGVDPDGAGGLPLVGPATARIDSYHHATKHGTGNDGGLRCWDCHDAHGDGANIKMIGSDVL
ncbi:MAG TPA: CxxxxCH/CxxCH domain-containing protein, partial [Anaeromyxobacter sp.]|nr:CxxxxCH/CxxCH domain-containing protein [Anaeromyxobacter sp.]